MRADGQLPELLSPAGSKEALLAAVEGGADAVYFGGPAFNARLRAANFTEEEMAQCVRLCHRFGVRAYITLNTQCTDRELPAFLEAATAAKNAGADALIVADIGVAALLHRLLPDLELHASTQAGVHSIGGARELAALGFTRAVLARETPAPDMARFVRESGMETEVFVHGALCVSHSGQCLFSSLVGGRSGNRGECAQPCRLPDARGRYPLSLRDLSLARHIPELIAMGVDSLKIEGRLKSPVYVREVTRVFRRLLDERRAATDGEMSRLSAVFSREGGFTDAYFTEKISHAMLGVRSASDKERSEALPPFSGLQRKIPLSLCLRMEAGRPLCLTATANGKSVSVAGEVPQAARTAPLDAAAIRKQLCRLGGTPYEIGEIEVSAQEGLMVPLSQLNALRRAALEALVPVPPQTAPPAFTSAKPQAPRVSVRSARFEDEKQITEEAEAFFPIRYLPPERYCEKANGVVIPPVIFERQVPAVREMLRRAVQKGARHALVGNIGHLDLAREAGLAVHGDYRLNVTNRETLSFLLRAGCADVLLSPELTLPQIRDIGGGCDVIVYGRIPLMLLEKCAGSEIGDCTACAAGKNCLTDRRGEKFPVLRVWPHRSMIVNSRPTYMADRAAALGAAGITAGHFIFTVESPRAVARVITAARQGTPPDFPVRRI